MRSVRPSGSDDNTTTERKGTMKLTTNTNVSVDGVMQGLGGPEEDRSGGVERGGWGMAYFAEGSPALGGPGLGRAGGLLFGRRAQETLDRARGNRFWGGNQGGKPLSAAVEG